MYSTIKPKEPEIKPCRCGNTPDPLKDCRVVKNKDGEPECVVFGCSKCKSAVVVGKLIGFPTTEETINVWNKLN